jgi:hypothetical protein
MGEERIGVSRADPVNLDPVEMRAMWSIWPRAADQIDAMTARDDAAEDLPEVKLGTAGVRVRVILPI